MIYVNKQAVAAAFNRAAQNYGKYAELQRRSTQGLLSLLLTRNFTTVLDAGCGPGNNSLFWRKAGSRVTALDIAPEMLTRARERQAADIYLIGDIENLPLLENKFDLVWSHLAVQWCSSLKQALTGMYRVAKSGGSIAFTTLLAGSLYELKIAWLSVDQRQHVNNFLTKEAIENILLPWRYRSNIQTITLNFDRAQSAMRSIKGIGATYLHCGRSKKLFTRQHLRSLEDNWPRISKYYPLTYQLFHGVIECD